MIDKLGYARSSAAAALKSLTEAAEWTEKAMGNSPEHTARLAETAMMLWTMADDARDAERDLAGIRTAARLGVEGRDEHGT